MSTLVNNEELVKEDGGLEPCLCENEVLCLTILWCQLYME